MSNGSGDTTSRFEIRVTSDSHFSWLRTRWSLERTMMSWLRTAVSLIGFGFTIVQFFQHVQDMQGVAPAIRPMAPRVFGLALIFSGVVALAISLWQYRTIIRYLWSGGFSKLAGVEEQQRHQTPLLAMTLLLLLIGVLTFLALLFRLA